jgi:hypothetical protein
LQRVAAIGRQCGERDRIDAGVIDGAPVGRQKTVGHLIVRRDRARRRKSVAADQHPLSRSRHARQIGWKREHLAHARVRRHQRAAAQQISAVHALRFVQHDVLHAAIGVGIELVDDEGREVGARRRRGEQHDK